MKLFRRWSRSAPPVATVAPAPVDAPPVLDKPIRMVALDLDGTLLTDDKQIDPATSSALQHLAQRDIPIILASARPPRSVKRFHDELNLNTWQINYNGALIWDKSTASTIFHQPIDASHVLSMIDAARDMFEEVIVTCEILDRWYTDRADDSFATETARLFKPDVICPIRSFCTQPITKLMLQGEARIINRLEPLLMEAYADHCTFVRQEDELLQIMDRRVSKAVALHRVASHYRVPMDQVMAIGDAPNDVGMLQLAGVGVAMSNASSVVKKVADWIAPANNDNGVLAALQRYGLTN